MDPENEERKEEEEQVVANEAQRLNVREIFATVVETGRDELRRPMAGLALSALAGGFTVGLSTLAQALVGASLGTGPGTTLLQAALYPIGFIAVIIGRTQFFTENTLFPVITWLAQRQDGKRVLAFWSVVLGSNLAGSALFALLAMKSDALSAATRLQLAELGVRTMHHGAGGVFWSAVIGGWLMALVAWMVSASQWTSGQILVTWLLTFLIALGNFAHCIAGSTDALASVLGQQAGLGEYLAWLLPAIAGNIAGGVVIVSLLNYGQVKAGGRQRPV